MADALGTPPAAATPTVGVVSDEDHRIALAGLIAPQTSSLAVRTGVLWGPGTTALVTGTAATGTMTYAIALHHSVTTRGTADGVYLGPNLEAAITVPTTAAPGANSRIDIIWEKQNDTSSTISADTGSTAPLYGVANGAAAASPVAPSIPVGAIELARATVATGATATNGANVTITQTAAQTVARGAAVPVRSQTERDALTRYPGLQVYRIDTGDLEMVNTAGTGWVTVWRTTPTLPLQRSVTPAVTVLSGVTRTDTLTSFTLPAACPVSVAAAFRAGNPGAALCTVEIDGVQVGNQAVSRTDVTVSVNGTVALAAGVHTVATKVVASGGDVGFNNVFVVIDGPDR